MMQTEMLLVFIFFIQLQNGRHFLTEEFHQVIQCQIISRIVSVNFKMNS